MIDARETFNGSWPFQPRYFEGNGFRMHYIDEGSGDPIVCLHGEPTWGYIYRRFIPPLAASHRVIVPDHMGFGKSETPPGREYSLRSHVENFTKLVEALDLTNITLVVQDWGGLIGSAFALRHPDRVRRLFLLNTVSGYGNAPPGLTPWFQFVLNHHRGGTLGEVLGHLNLNILSVMKTQGLENLSVVNPDWLAAYGSPFTTKEECIGAIEFPLDALLGRIQPYLAEGLPLIQNLKSKPAMLAVGMKDRAILPDTQIADFSAVWPGRPIIRLPNAGHFSQEDAPETVIALIELFISSTK
ncbi:alpha/beta fold hydrolase [Bradyrhizobium vignae]|uniref:Putative hydrolase or acyltransferase of alpha/beta superfamily n=1 Tax=Bradyrhizobium vignae TaxID=1549949 RepID=A0A2U3PUW4_9BRAD|nr:alpha/beta fold hydrolase [Bradyrhizobium vignae]SPP92961.1 putative hydrolase or acyltransferase of alpha/beta superfamily [Bradyrhizobium vignae]